MKALNDTQKFINDNFLHLEEIDGLTVQAQITVLSSDDTDLGLVASVGAEIGAKDNTAKAVRAFIARRIDTGVEIIALEKDQRKAIGAEMRTFIRAGYSTAELKENGGIRVYNAATQAFKRFWDAIDESAKPVEAETTEPEAEPETQEDPEVEPEHEGLEISSTEDQLFERFTTDLNKACTEYLSATDLTDSMQTVVETAIQHLQAEWLK